MTSRLVVSAALVLGALALAAPPPARADDPAQATVVLNGKEEQAEVTPIEGDGAAPRADDLLRIGGWSGFTMMRGDVKALRLRHEQGRWFEIADDGKETLVGLSVSDGNTISADLLPPDDAVEVPEDRFAALRGISFNGWKPEFEPMLRRIEASKCFVDVSVGLHRKVPVLPDGLRALRVEGFLKDPIDLRPLANETKLRRLVVDRANVPDWSPLAGMKELIHLAAEVRPAGAATVPTLPSVRSFSAGHERDVTDIAFVARFPGLRDLDLAGTGVSDLSPIESLREIRAVEATMSAVAKLPSGNVTSLRKLRLLRHHVPAAELRAFLDANPQCETEHSWRALLDAKIAGVDGVRLRTGGQCHRDEPEEDTLFESKDAKEVRDLLAAIAIDESGSRGQCMCCGGPTIELLRDGKIAASLTIHHGQALRWYGWPGDGRLTEDSADALCAWLTKHGAPSESPREKAKREAAEAKARAAAQDALLGAERGSAARACKCWEDFAEVARAAAPDIDARIVLLLRLSVIVGGAEDTPGAELRGHAERALREEDKARVAVVLRAVLTDPATPRDLALAASETVHDLDDDDLPLSKEALAELRMAAARSFIARGDALGRHRAVRVLERAGTPEAAALAGSLLPPVGKDGRPLTQPRRDEMGLAIEIAFFCDEKDLPRIRALAAASRDPKRWAEEIERRIERRRKSEPAAPR